MRVKVKCCRCQAFSRKTTGWSMLWFAMLFAAVFLCSCAAKSEEMPVIPPATYPLSQPLVGFGVVNVSYIQVVSAPLEIGTSLGYLRKGDLVRILERRMVKNGKTIEAWVLADGSCRGWLRESAVDIYDNELRAQTASGFMNR